MILSYLKDSKGYIIYFPYHYKQSMKEKKKRKEEEEKDEEGCLKWKCLLTNNIVDSWKFFKLLFSKLTSNHFSFFSLHHFQ